MIVRSWTGRVPPGNAGAFVDHLEATGINDYRSQPGCLDVRLWRSDEDGWAVFTLISVWNDMDAIRAYAGSAPSVAVLYPGDEALGLVPDTQVRHFELVHANPELAP